MNDWVLDHRRQVYGLARSYYRSVPLRHRCWLDRDDLFMLAFIHLIRQAGEYSPDRGARSNFVQNVVSRKLQDFILRLNQECRNEARTISLTGIEPVIPTTCKYFGDSVAEKRVLEFFRLASEEAAQYILTALRSGHRKGRRPQDLTWAVQRSGVTVEDFLLCLPALV